MVTALIQTVGPKKTHTQMNHRKQPITIPPKSIASKNVQAKKVKKEKDLPLMSKECRDENTEVHAKTKETLFVFGKEIKFKKGLKRKSYRNEILTNIKDHSSMKIINPIKESLR